MSKTILHIAPTPFFSDRGCHIRIEGIVRCLTELGHKNIVCTYHHGRDVEGVKTQRIKTITNYTQTAAGPSKYKLLADWRLLLLCIKQYRHLRPDVIHAHLHEGLLIGLLVKLLFFWRGTPVIGDMQGSLFGELAAHGSFDSKPYLKWPIKSIEWTLMKLANHIFCSSQHSLNKIQQDFSVKPNKISLAQDGADSVNVLTENRRSKIIQKWKIPEDKVLVIYSGALLASKGLDELKTVIKSADQEQVHFIIVGYPTVNLMPFLREQNLLDCCTLTGQIEFEQLGDYLSLADIALDPKNSDAGEGSGKMLNYLAAGLPVLAFDTANNREFLPDETMLATNVGEMVSILTQLVLDKAKRLDIADVNLKQFTDNYSWFVTKKQLKSYYSSV